MSRQVQGRSPLEAGADYLLYRKQRREIKPRRPLGIALLAVGAVFVALSAGYFLYATYARSQLAGLVASGPLSLPSDNLPAETPAKVAPPETGEVIYVLSPQAVSLYPARVLQPQDWLNPLWGEPPRATPGTDLLSQYLPVDWSILPPSTTLAPTRMRIPSINLDTKVEGLRILNLGDSRAYETPKFTVGHIPESSNPGAADNGWYFGHLESPIRKEGAIFSRLPEILDLWRTGQKVHVIVDTEHASYLYQVVTRPRVVSTDDFELTSSSEPTITLVTCVPRWVYDQRLLVEAKLVGVMSLPGS
ncbi:MAG: sortase [Dehalococcoidia bacterium]|nr:sortase [Dehalococcoidia bacterium]